jgi:cupin superfamily acireductone dioxygenase involved in methionine salvage
MMDLQKILLQKVGPKTQVHITSDMRDDFESIPPGTMHKLTTSSGQEFAVLRLEDLEVILRRANMALAD